MAIIVVFLVASLGATLTIDTPAAFALTAYQSGFQHGVSDGKADGVNWYILEPGKGFQFHIWEFVRGYVNGFCNVSPNSGSDSDEASWDCTLGPNSASWVSPGGLNR